MTRDDIIRLLQIAASYDNRTIPQASICAWFDAAGRARWTYPEAAEAMKTHYTESTVWIMPGHVTERIRVARQDTAMREALDPPADPAGQQRLSALIAGVFPSLPDGSADFMSIVLSQRCPACGAEPGQPCTRETPEGRVVIRFPHLPRMRPHREAS